MRAKPARRPWHEGQSALASRWLPPGAEVEPILPRAIVRFESGMALVVDERMRWEKAG